MMGSLRGGLASNLPVPWIPGRGRNGRCLGFGRSDLLQGREVAHKRHGSRMEPPSLVLWTGRALTVGMGSMTSHLSVVVSSCWAVSGSRIRTITSSRPPVGRRPSRTWDRMRREHCWGGAAQSRDWGDVTGDNGRRSGAPGAGLGQSGVHSCPSGHCPPLTSRISRTSQAVSRASSFSWAVPSTRSVLNSPLCEGGQTVGPESLPP
jgi:hypothetical protein